MSLDNEIMVSVLMPSLNVSAYIRQCLDSVLAQTLLDIEVICIDAGSTDGTYEILQEYSERDPRIQIIQSSRKSYGFQMNLGLNAAHGEYIGIVETDDWADPFMFEKLYQAASGSNADVVWSNFISWFPQNADKKILSENFENLEYNKITTAYENNCSLFGTSPAIWSGIYKREFLQKNQIRFNETPGASYQDTSFHFAVCAIAERVILLRDAFLHYRRDNEDSSVNSVGKVYCICDEMHFCEQFILERGLDEHKLFPVLYYVKFKNYFWNFLRIAKRYQWDFLMRMRKEFAAHEEAGYLQQEYFDTGSWRVLQQVLHQPLRFYLAYCKTNSLFTNLRELYFSKK